MHDLILHLLCAANDLCVCICINYCMTNNWLKSRKALEEMIKRNLQEVDGIMIRLIKHSPVDQEILC